MGDHDCIEWDKARWSDMLEQHDSSIFAVRIGSRIGLATKGRASLSGVDCANGPPAADEGLSPAELVAYAPPLPPEQLGDADFRAAHGVRFAYISGEMANAIGSVELVTAMARAEAIGFFGAAGLDLPRIADAIHAIRAALAAGQPWGINLIHSPHDPSLENATADLYIREDVPTVCASAYLGLTPAVVRLRVSGVMADDDGRPVAARRLIAKVSRVEVARKFLSPPPEKMLAELAAAGRITATEAGLAARMPMCDDLTAEADSGGHTDNRPAITLIPTMIALRDEVAREYEIAAPPRVGAAGGIATPASVAGAFALGAAYVVTGSINQACVEAGTSDTVRAMLAQAQQADVMMAPAADMFEMGVQVQVLKRGTLFAVRARKLYELYRSYESLEAIPVAQRAALERDWFRMPLEQVWETTRRFFEQRDPGQVERASREPKHRMALVFRWYLGLSSQWANAGEPSRQADYQVWCGPAMGAFNEWARGSVLEAPSHRNVATIAYNLLYGAAKLTRAAGLRAQGLRLPRLAQQYLPRPMSKWMA